MDLVGPEGLNQDVVGSFRKEARRVPGSRAVGIPPGLFVFCFVVKVSKGEVLWACETRTWKCKWDLCGSPPPFGFMHPLRGVWREDDPKRFRSMPSPQQA